MEYRRRTPSSATDRGASSSPSSAAAQLKGELGGLPVREQMRALQPDRGPVLQGKFTGGSAEAAQADDLRSAIGGGGGSPMPAAVQAKMEHAFGTDFSSVRVQESAAAPALGALAFTQGESIQFAPGQYQPESAAGQQLLGHELSHVVQQRAGRVQATTEAGGVAVNDNAGLEAEADRHGALAAAGERVASAGNSAASASGVVQNKAIQLKKVATDAGEFETTTFQGCEDRGVNIVLMFHPNPDVVEAKKIGLAQSGQVSKDGKFEAIDPSKQARTVTDAGESEGYTHDRLSDRNNPIYGADSLKKGQGLAATKVDNNETKDATQVGVNATYQLGWSYKLFGGKPETKTQSAGLSDKPKGAKVPGVKMFFESTALAIEGTDTGKYYGSVSWGYEMKGTADAPVLEMTDIELASASDPTAKFLDSAKLWNEATTRGTAIVTADPAKGLNGAGTANVDVPKDTKLKQLSTVSWGSDAAIKAEILDAKGKGTGTVVYVKNADLKDAGDGGKTVALPMPEQQND
jgi:hypothetical protein